MKEELQKEVISTVKDEIEEIKSSLKERIKLPLLIAYCIILVIYNWDVLFYIVFENGIASDKIEYINKNFTNKCHYRFLVPLVFSLISTFIFPALQVGINILFKKIKDENDEIVREREKANVEHEKSLTDLKSSNKERDILQADVDIKKGKILDLESEIQKITKQNTEIKDSLKLEKEDTKYLTEIFLHYSDPNYRSETFSYFKYFKDFYNYYLNSSEKEQKFITDLFYKFSTEGYDKMSFKTIERISSFDFIDNEKLFKDFESIGIINEEVFRVDLELNDKGREVLYIFRSLINLPRSIK